MILQRIHPLITLFLVGLASPSSYATDGHAADDELALAAAQLTAQVSTNPLAPAGLTITTALAIPTNPTDCVNTGSWSSLIPWTPHIPVSAANLPDGRILTFASNQRTSFPAGPEFTYAATWDPATGTFREYNNTTHDMFCGGITLMPDGRVMVNGGRNETPYVSVFDWRTNAWTRVQNMNGGRWYNTTVSLANGQVFTATGNGTGKNTTERWNSSGWSVLTGIAWPTVLGTDPGYITNWHPFLSLAPDGRLLHFGPTDTMHWFDVSGTGTLVKANATVPGTHYPKEGCWVMYDEGHILVAGGGANTTANPGDNTIGTSTTSAYTVDMSTTPPTVAATAPMNYPRQFCNAIVLPSGEVLVIGGNSPGQKFSDAGAILPCEIWNPRTGAWRTVASVAVCRAYHSVALLLPDGRVISGGGGLSGGAGDHQDAQLYSPPCLFTNTGAPATRPTIDTAPATINPGTVFNVKGTSGLVKFAFIRMAAITHSVTTDQRYLSLPFTEPTPGSYQLTAHSNVNVMTPGYWMLFGIDSTGAYSLAQTILVDATSGITVSQPGDQRTNVGTAVSFQINATAPSGTTLTYAATGLPVGLALNSSTGLITGTPSASGVSSVRITAKSGTKSAFQDFSWIVLLTNTGTGQILREWWLNIPNTDLASLTSNPAYPNNPTGSDMLTTFETPTNWAQNMGQRVRGFVIPPVTGQYRFWIASDDEGRLILSTDNNPANGKIIATTPAWTNPDQWTKYPEQTSAPISLTAGKPYYIEALMKQGTSLDNLGVAWQLPATSGQVVISGQYLSPLIVNHVPVITNPGAQTNVVGNTVSYGVTATDSDLDPLTFSAVGLPPGLSMSSVTGRIAGTPTTVGTFNVTVTVTDNRSSPVTASFAWTINPQLDLSPAPPAATGAPGNVLTYSITSSGGLNPRIQWSWGDGTPDSSASSSTSASHSFASPGRYQITVTGSDDTGRITTVTFYQAIAAALTAARPTASSSIVYEQRSGGSNNRLWSVNQDNNSVSVFDAVTRNRLAEISVGAAPRSLAIAPTGSVWVTNIESGTISVINGSTFAITQTIKLPRGSRPFGIAFSPDGSNGWIACEGSGLLLRMNPASGAIVASLPIGQDIHHVSVSADSARVFVSRFITPPLPGENTAVVNPSSTTGGEVYSVTTANFAVEKKTILQHSDRADTITTGRGIPNYLGPAVISPDGLTAWVASKQDNIKRGRLRDGNDLTHDQTIRSIASRISLTNGSPELVDDTNGRVDFDNAGIAVNAAFDANGIYLFTALEGSREVGIVDVWNKKEVRRFSAGRAPQGIAVAPDGRTIFVQNFMDRTITVHDVGEIIDGRVTTPVLIATLNCITTEQLTPNVLLGKKHFYDSADRRIAFEQYISCASCHNDGGHDGRVWDFTGFGEGLRNTITLRGHGGTAQGPVHWTGNFDEIQDFENQIHSLPAGTGLIAGGAPNPPLGAPNAGRSLDLDSLADFVAFLTHNDASPFRNEDGTLTSSAAAGKVVFNNSLCSSCHSGPQFTDSAVDRLHDVGTIKPSSGSRLDAQLTGFDTPTLRGLWNTAPYLHDGSAATIADAIAAHTKIASAGLPIKGSQPMTDLVNYLKSIDDAEPVPSLATFAVTLTAPASTTGQFVVNGSVPLLFTSALDASTVIVNNGSVGSVTTQPELGLFSFVVTPIASGPVTVTLPASALTFNNGAASSLASNQVTTVFTPLNSAPSITPISTQTSVRGDSVSVQVNATDPDGNTLSYTANGLPLGLTIDATGLITGTIASLAANSNSVTITVSDGSLSDSTNFVWNTTPGNVAPTLTTPPTQSSVRGSAASLQIVANDADANPLTFTASGLPAGLNINPTTGLISGIIASNAASTNTVAISVSDGQLSASSSFDWNVTNPAGTATLTATSNIITAQTFAVTLALTTATSVSNADFQTTNCTIQGISGSGTTWVVTLRPVNAGSMTVSYATTLVSSNTLNLTYGPPAAFHAQVNFQPAAAPVPDGYVADSGDMFGPHHGLVYGWSMDQTTDTRDRNNVTDQRQDTLILARANSRWEIAVPNGSYDVTISVGDATNSSFNSLLVEGVSVSNQQRLGAGVFSVKTVTSQVFDGRLTINNTATANGQTRINYIDIHAAGAPISHTNGLTADYFAGQQFEQLRFSRIDTTIDNDWQANAPDARLPADGFSVRWHGYLVPRYTESYSFNSTTDDGVRLWINDQLIIDNWTDHGATIDTGSVNLTAGVPVSIKMEYYDSGGAAVAKLEWQSLSQSLEVIPTERLLIDQSGGVAPTYPTTFAEWLASNRISGGNTSSDTDLDGVSDLAEYALGSSAGTGVQVSDPLSIDAGSTGSVVVSNIHPSGLADITFKLQGSNDLKTWTNETITPTNFNLGNGSERMAWSNPQHAIVRLQIIHSSGATALTTPVTAQRLTMGAGVQTVGVSVVRPPVFTGVIASASGTTLTLADNASLVSAIDTDAHYYIEIRGGIYTGHRIDVQSVSDASLTLDLSALHNTLNTLPSGLIGASIVVRPHWTLGAAFDPDKMQASSRQPAADQVIMFRNEAYVSYWLYDGGPDVSKRGWLSTADASFTNYNDLIIPPGTGVMVKIASGQRNWALAGQVRTNACAQRLVAGHNLIASPWPVDQSAASLGLVSTGFATGDRRQPLADQLQRWTADEPGGVQGFQSYWLYDNGTSIRNWVSTSDATLASMNNAFFLLAHHCLFYKAQPTTAAQTWNIPLPQ